MKIPTTATVERSQCYVSRKNKDVARRYHDLNPNDVETILI
jgi:hypothetical protein